MSSSSSLADPEEELPFFSPHEAPVPPRDRKRSSRDVFGFSPHEPRRRNRRRAGKVRPRRLVLPGEGSRETTSRGAEGSLSHEKTDDWGDFHPEFADRDGSSTEEEPVELAYDALSDSSSTERTERPLFVRPGDRRPEFGDGLIARAEHFGTKPTTMEAFATLDSNMKDPTAHEGDTGPPHDTRTKEQDQVEEGVEDVGQHGDEDSPMSPPGDSSPTQATQVSEEFDKQDAQAADQVVSEEFDKQDVVTVANASEVGQKSASVSRPARPSVPPTIYVHPGRLTRAQYQALGGAKSGARGLKGHAVPADPPHQLVADATIAETLAEDVDEEIGGVLTPSDEDQDSDYVLPKKVRAESPRGTKRVQRPRNSSSSSSDSDSDKQTSARGSVRGSVRESSAEEDSGDDGDGVEIPEYVYQFDGPPPPADGSFVAGMQREFESWADFNDEVHAYTQHRYQLFKKRTSSSIAERNSKVKNPENRLPERFGTYAVTLKCVHGMTRNAKTQKRSQKSTAKSRKLAKTKAKSKRAKTKATASNTESNLKINLDSTTKPEKRRYSRFIGCTATINATVQRVRPPEKLADGSVVDDGCVIRWKSKGGHNHPTTRELFKYYPEIRLPKTENMFSDVERMLSCGGNATGICLTYRRETGLPSKVRDFQNVIAKVRREKVAGTTVADRLDAHLRAFVQTPGNWATVYVDPKTSETQSVTYQSARMQRLFAAGPQVVMVDCTHGTNKSKFTLFSFVVHDLFGKGQYVFHSLMKRENMDNMEDAIEAFIKANPSAGTIRAFIVDKDFKERKLLRKFFPHARILLCHYHVIKVFAKKVKDLVRGTKEEKDELIAILRAMVYARSRGEYDALKLLFAKSLAHTMEADSEHEDPPDDDENDLLEEDMEDSDSDEEPDVSDNEEARKRAVEAVRSARDDEDVRRGKLHRMFRYFVKNWEPCEREWLMFLRGNVAHLGNNTNNRIEAKWGAGKRILNARMDMEETIRSLRELQAINEDEYIDLLTKTGTRHSYTGDPELDMLINMLSDHAYDLVSSEYLLVKNGDVQYSVREINGSAVLKSTAPPAGDDHVEHTIDLNNYQCSCLFSQVRLLPCRHVFFYRTRKGFDAVVPFKNVNPRWSLRNPANDITKGDVTPARYRVRDTKPRADTDLTQGDKFCKVMSVLKPIAGAVARMKPSHFSEWVRALEKIRDSCEGGVVPRLVPEGEGGDGRDGSSNEDADNVGDLYGAADQGSHAAAGHTELLDDTEDSVSDVDGPRFKISAAYNTRPARNRKNMADRKKMEDKIKKDAAAFLRRGAIPATGFSLADVEATLTTKVYTFRDAIPLVCGIPIERVDAEWAKKQPEHVVTGSQAVRFILVQAVLERLAPSLPDPDAVPNEEEVAFVGNGKAVLSATQLRTMECFHEALDCVNEVCTAIAWLRRIKITDDELPFPFNNVTDHMNKTFIADAVSSCETLPLGQVRTHLDAANGRKILELASDSWLSTTTISALLACISGPFCATGVVKPEYFTVKDKGARQRILASTDPFGVDKDKVIGILNLDGAHWMAFAFNIQNGFCLLYDPLRIGRRDRAPLLKKAVGDLLEHAGTEVDVEYMPHTEMGDLDQDDGNSCGVYCAVFLELVLNVINLSDEIVLPSRVYRARYMTMVGIVMRKLAELEDK